MIIYGLNPVREALRAHPSRIRYIGVANEQRARLGKLLEEARGRGVVVRNLTEQQLERLANGGVHNGVLAELSQTEYADFDQALLNGAEFLLILDGVQDPQNLGAVLRVSDIFGVDLVIIPEHQSVGLTGAAVKASAGASEWVAVSQVTNLARSIEALKKEGFWVYAADTGGDDIGAIDFRGKVAVVLGNEGKGIRRNVLDHCDRRIAIPMHGHVDSLNVAAAAAVICYEVAGQRRKTEQ